ncbi:3703_t:CDS:2 [Entrophospora sp. SA101]|nr:3703_t:CDS:2 [Entrophospora sp. SA101]
MTIVNNHTDQTASSLLKSDPKLSSGEVKVDTNKYGKLATEETIAKTKEALETKGHQVTVLNTSEEAYEFLKKLIPANASVNNGHSTTLEEIGFIEYLKTAKEWVNVHAEILAEKDFAKQSEIRRLKGYNVDYYLSEPAEPKRDTSESKSSESSKSDFGSDNPENQALVSSPSLSVIINVKRSWEKIVKNGFSVEDGPLMAYDDPENQEFLKAIRSGRAPLSLLNVSQNQPVDVRVSRRLDEDYKPPPKKPTRPFSGSGQRLGSIREFEVDESLPITSLQIRLADGTRMLARFNHTHTVNDIRNFINASRVGEAQRNYLLQTSFPD